MTGALGRELARLAGDDAVVPVETRWLQDATETRGVRGRADAVVLPETTDAVAAVLEWCYERGVPVTPRGGGTGYAGGAVPTEGGVVLGLERLRGVRLFEPLLWRAELEAGLTTATVRRLARENGLLFPPDPGAAEQSQLGGNVATNAGGPHALKYGVTREWVTGLEVVVPPGDVVRIGGPFRKDVAGYDLGSLLVGSEGTLGIVTAAWLRFVPAPAAAVPVVAAYPDTARGCAAVEYVLGSGCVPAALEFVDAAALRLVGAGLPLRLPEGAGFLVLAEADGEAEEASREAGAIAEALAEGALAVERLAAGAESESVWRWRSGISLAVATARGGKASEDVVVPVDRLAEAIERVFAIGRRHGLEACSWGHAGDGNLHATFLVDRADPDALARAADAADDLFALAVELGGSISGEHGIGSVKAGQLGAQWPDRALELHAGVKRVFDPKGLLNPGKKR